MKIGKGKKSKGGMGGGAEIKEGERREGESTIFRNSHNRHHWPPHSVTHIPAIPEMYTYVFLIVYPLFHT